MALTWRITYPLAVVVLPLLLVWMYLQNVTVTAFMAGVVLWIIAMLLRDFSAYTLRGRRMAYLQTDYQELRRRLFPAEVEAERAEREMAFFRKTQRKLRAEA